MIKISTSLLRFFGNHILRKLPEKNDFVFSNNYYWRLSSIDLYFYTKEQEKNFGLGSLFYEFSYIKSEVQNINSKITSQHIEEFAILLSEIAKSNILPRDDSAENFIFSKEILINIWGAILEKLDLTGNSSIEVTKTLCWIIPYQHLFDLEEFSDEGNRLVLPKQVDLKPEIETLLAIYEGNRSINEFNPEMFYWILRVYVYALDYSENSFYWLIQKPLGYSCEENED